MSEINISQKINISFPASIMTGGSSLDDKTKDYVNRYTGGRVNSSQEVTQLG